MKIVQINTTYGIGSTGKICVAIGQELDKRGVENYAFYSVSGIEDEKSTKLSSGKYINLQALKAKLLGNWGFNSHLATKKLVKELEKIKPDIVHLHNIHGHDLDLDLLFKYFKKVNQKLYWTFHDCWTLTGYCTHFALAKCDKWKEECKNCPQYKSYSLFFDRSKYLFNKKKALFSGLDLKIITPSNWLSDLVKQSIFKNYPVKVIHSGIDLEIFRPTESDFRARYNIGKNKKIILGIAFNFGYKKGLDVFVELSKRLSSNEYQFVLVGVSTDTKEKLPSDIISIQRTQSQKELAEIYSSADVFLNPTREEVLGLTNLEALACGTPVITFNTGGSPECIDENCGLVIECEDIDSFEQAVYDVTTKNLFKKEACLERAKKFDKNLKYKEYADFYFE